MIRQCLFAFALLIATVPLTWAQNAEAPPDPAPEQQVGPEPDMTFDRLRGIILALDEEALIQGAGFQFTIDDVPVLVITDPRADRLRAMVPIRAADGLEPDELMRLMQANFDTALDARYAVAQGRLWGVYIHPLSPLQREQFVSALVQVVNVAKTYGSLYFPQSGLKPPTLVGKTFKRAPKALMTH